MLTYLALCRSVLGSVLFIILIVFKVVFINSVCSLSQQEIRKELETIKQFRQKDSIRIAMLLNEIQLLINNEKNTPSITNSSTTNEKEIEKLRNKMRGRPIVFEKDTLYYLYTSYGPYDIDTRVKYVEEKLKELYNDPYFVADSIKIKPAGDYLSVMYNDKTITGVSIVDALWENSSQTELAQRYANIIKNTIVKYKEQNSLKSVLIRLAELLLVLFITFILVSGESSLNISPTLIFDGLSAKLLSLNTAIAGSFLAIALITVSGISLSKQAIMPLSL